MLFKDLDLTKKIKLLINNVEMDFDSNFKMDDHPTNFSSMVFYEVIPKSKNYYPENLKVQKFAEEFSIGEVYSGDQLIFFGIVNSTGRLNLHPTIPKTKTIEIADFRKWLSIKKPIELLFFKKSPESVVVSLIQDLNEPKIVVGNLDFTNNDLINAYSTFNKSPYQILKEVIAKQTNSILYFQINKEKQITINFKSNKTLQNNIEKLVIDLDNLETLEEYKILNVEFESNADRYANVVRCESENIISNIKTKETIDITDSENISTIYNIGTIINNLGQTYIYKKNEPTNKVKLIILNNKNYVESKYYDILYTQNKSTIKVNKKYLNLNYVLQVVYNSQRRTSIELTNYKEIENIANKSNTNGDVYRFEKYNDLTSFEDLLKITNTNLEINKQVEKSVIITSEKPLYNILDVVSVLCGENDVSGLYLVHQVSCSFYGSVIKDDLTNNLMLPEFMTLLKSTKNIDNLVNEFDNQNFRDNPVIEDFATLETVETLNLKGQINMITETNIITLKENQDGIINAELNYKIFGKRFDIPFEVEEIINE